MLWNLYCIPATVLAHKKASPLQSNINIFWHFFKFIILEMIDFMLIFFYICCICLVILNLMTTSWKRGVKPMTPAPIKLDQRASTVHIIVVNYASTRNIYVIVHWKREGLYSWKPFECRMTFHSWDNLLILIIADYFSTFTKFLFGAQHSCFRKKKDFWMCLLYYWLFANIMYSQDNSVQ